LSSNDTLQRRSERVEVRHFIDGAAGSAERLGQHSQRDLLGAVRKFWDYRGLARPSRVLVKIVIKRHSPKASRTGRGSAPQRGRRPHSDLLAPHFQRDPLGAVQNFWAYRAWFLLPRYSSRLGSSDTVERRAQRVEVRQYIDESAASTADRMAHHLQGDPIGTVRNFWDYRVLMPPSMGLVLIAIERHGQQASGTGRGSQFYRRGRPQNRRSLGSPASTRPDRCCRQLLGLPSLDFSF
jgi:hypothetical protein